MKKLSSATVAFALFGVMTVACVSGSIGGTLAWYAYSTRANVSYSGASVNETALLQIGICSDVPLTGMPASISSVTYTGDTNYYYFSDPGKGLTYDVIAKYLEEKGYATNELEPSTSGSYASGMDEERFSLKQAPNELVRGNSLPAYQRDYVYIPFVFRIQGNEADSYLDNQELWLTKAVARAASANDGEIYKALRVFIDRDPRNYGAWQEVTGTVLEQAGEPTADYGYDFYLDISNNNFYQFDNNTGEWNLLKSNISIETSEPDVNAYAVGDYYLEDNGSSDPKVLYKKSSSDLIFNPSANNRGQTRVGGVLNRQRDDYYDYDVNGEILYGEYDASALDLLSDTGYSGPNNVVDVNGVGNNTPSTFVAKHYPTSKYYSDLSSHDNLFKHAEYESLSDLAPARDERDYLSNPDENHPSSVCKTRADDHHLARVNMTVYLEGWDFAVVDEEVSNAFDLGLTFEMSRL